MAEPIPDGETLASLIIRAGENGAKEERRRAAGILGDLLAIIDGLTRHDRAAWEQTCAASFKVYQRARAYVAEAEEGE